MSSVWGPPPLGPLRIFMGNGSTPWIRPQSSPCSPVRCRDYSCSVRWAGDNRARSKNGNPWRNVRWTRGGAADCAWEWWRVPWVWSDQGTPDGACTGGSRSGSPGSRWTWCTGATCADGRPRKPTITAWFSNGICAVRGGVGLPCTPMDSVHITRLWASAMCSMAAPHMAPFTGGNQPQVAPKSDRISSRSFTPVVPSPSTSVGQVLLPPPLKVQVPLSCSAPAS